MLLKRDLSALILVDVQEKLTPKILQHESLITRCEWLLRLANACSVPVLSCEQYPSGLGKTVEPLASLLSEASIEKTEFSCYQCNEFANQWHKLNKKQAVIIGIETHVCVLQTALDLIEQDFQVFVVVDSVSCRSELDKTYGLKRMKQAGAELLTSEMVFFEWLENAGTSEFKELVKQFF